MNTIERLCWLWISLELVGTIAVIIGVWGEEYFERKVLPYHRQERLKWCFWMILLSGLGIELLGLVGTTTTSFALENKVELLRKANDSLEAEIQPRRIMPEQRKQILDMLYRWRIDRQKCNIELMVDENDREAEIFAGQIDSVLRGSGFNVSFVSAIGQGVKFGTKFRIHNPPSESVRAVASALKILPITPITAENDPKIDEHLLIIEVHSKPLQ